MCLSGATMASTNKAMIVAGVATMMVESFIIIFFPNILINVTNTICKFAVREGKYTIILCLLFCYFQAVGQMIFTSLGLMQYFCVIDFLRELPLLIFIKIIYFHNPAACGSWINIGNIVDGVPSQALVTLERTPITAERTFFINCVSLAVSVVWFITAIGLMRGGARNKSIKALRWPWIFTTVIVSGVDLVATAIFANDSFHTRTLSDTMAFIGGSASAVGNVEINTSWASWVMVLLYSRFAVIFMLNLFLIVSVILHVNEKRGENISVQVEAPIMVNQASSVSSSDEDSSRRTERDPVPRIPRPGLSQSFRRMKAKLFRRPPPSPQPVKLESAESASDSSPERSPRAQHAELEKKRTVNFPANLLSLPQRLENMIAEQQRRLDRAVVDTSGRRSPPRASQSEPHLPYSEGCDGADVATRRLSSRASDPGRTSPRPPIECATSCPPTRTYRLFRSRITRPSRPSEKLPSTEPLPA